MTPPDSHLPLTALEQALNEALQRVARLEQALGAIIEAKQTTVTALTQVAGRVTALENSAGALRTRTALAEASKLFPKIRTIIFVGKECGGDSRFEYFGDNIKYAFLSFCAFAKANDIACYFLTDDEKQYKQVTEAGLPCLPWFVPDWTAAHIRILLGASVAVLCNVFYPVDERGYLPYALLQGAKFIQLWHGIPLKEIGMENLHSPHAYRPRIAEVLSASGPFAALVGPGEAMRAEWAQRFSFHHYAPLGYPRNDALFRAPSAQDLINVDRESLAVMETAAREKKPVVFYAPTFRDHKPGAWFDEAGMGAFGEYCVAGGQLLCVNLHPFEQGRLGELCARYPRIRFIAPQTDIYPLLRHASVLVTDYSSLAFDYILLDRPIIFFRPDHEGYIAKSRPLIANADDYICGEVTRNVDGLITATENAIRALTEPKKDAYAKLRQALRQRLYDHGDGQAAQRLNQLIMEQL